MKLYTCYYCKKELLIECFHWNHVRRGVQRGGCKICHAAYMKRYHSKIRDLKKKEAINILYIYGRKIRHEHFISFIT
jgi:hypothetical protein